ncbi:MAG: 16S rRNA (cytidine(1402)-2'-O)-methyltransferase [Microscillaceae bacterium]|nr:16S rRNA (cytidine(1402)-2'-O)-methyltransferase [Microscillaceae bacterium]
MDQPNQTSVYIVPTPIGNLEDITLRALRILKEVDLILCEDTRKTGILLKHFEISKPLKSYHNFNEHKILSNLIDKLKTGEKMALVSDAGTPGISDPGFLLIREVIKEGIVLECLPGATAFVPALLKSGLPTERFVFEGFLPHKKGRKTRLDQLIHEPRTLIFYESPHRLLKTLEQFISHFGADRQVSVSRELTKIYEETINGSLEDVLNHYKEKNIKGEIVIILKGKEK